MSVHSSASFPYASKVSKDPFTNTKGIRSFAATWISWYTTLTCVWMHSQDILRPRHTRDGYYLRKSERNILNLAYRQYKLQKRSLFRVHAHACANPCVLYTPCRGVNTCNVLITRLEVSVRRLHPSTTHATGWMATTFLETKTVSCFPLACLKLL